MAVYQSYGYGSEKTAVIFDIGFAYTKVGFAGENGPRSIIPSQLKHKSGKVFKIYEHPGSDEEELYINFVDFFYMLYFRHLLVNPKERRVVIVESVLLASMFRNTIAKVLFKHYEVPSILFAPSHLVSLFTLGIPSGLVMDVGFQETLVLPIYEGNIMLKGCQSLPLAGRAIHNLLEAKLLESATITCGDVDKPLSSVMDKVEDRILEDIKVRCCFVTKHERAQTIHAVNQGRADASQLPMAPPGVDYPLDGNKILRIDGRLRENTCEVLFEQDAEKQSIATLVLDSILQCPIDVRKTLASHLVVTGGTSMLPGFQHRLMAELRALAQLPRYKAQLSTWQFKLQLPPAKANYVAWLGGAILGSLEVLASRSLTLKQYAELPTLPDWCCPHAAASDDGEDRTLLALRTGKPVGSPGSLSARSSASPAGDPAPTPAPAQPAGKPSASPKADSTSRAPKSTSPAAKQTVPQTF